MYIYLGGNTVISTNDILGIFDMDTSTVNKATRDYLSNAEKNKKTVFAYCDYIYCSRCSDCVLVYKEKYAM